MYPDELSRLAFVMPSKLSTSLNLTVSLDDLPWLLSVTVIVLELDDPVSNGLIPKSCGTAVSVLSVQTFCRETASAGCGPGCTCGAFASNSVVCTKDPFHSNTISLYGYARPLRSDIAFEYFPLANLGIWIIILWCYVCA